MLKETSIGSVAVSSHSRPFPEVGEHASSGQRQTREG